MYSVSAAAGAAWQGLFKTVAQRAGMSLDYLDYPAPAPLADLWEQPNLAAVFMCGLPYARAIPPAHALAVPVPSPADFRGLPQYWSEFIVQADSGFERIEDTFGGRLACTDPDSQSGFAAAMRTLMSIAGSFPLYGELIAPQITPLGAISAIQAGAADVAPVDAYAWQLLQRYRNDLTAGLRSVGQTARTAMPLLVSSGAPSTTLQQAFMDSGADPRCRPWLDQLELAGFTRPDRSAYDELAADFELSRRFWRQHALAAVVHPAFVV